LRNPKESQVIPQENFQLRNPKDIQKCKGSLWNQKESTKRIPTSAPRQLNSWKHSTAFGFKDSCKVPLLWMQHPCYKAFVIEIGLNNHALKLNWIRKGENSFTFTVWGIYWNKINTMFDNSSFVVPEELKLVQYSVNNATCLQWNYEHYLWSKLWSTWVIMSVQNTHLNFLSWSFSFCVCTDPKSKN